MLNIVALLIVLFVVSFLETGISLDEYSETLLYAPEEGDEVEGETAIPLAAPESPQPGDAFRTATTDAGSDAEQLLERIYREGQ